LRLAALRKSYQSIPVRRSTAWVPGDYKKYLESPVWARRRLAVLKERGRRCETCGYGPNVTVHHLTYAALGAEPDSHLVVLCWPCHEKRHPEKGIASGAARARKAKAAK
jgi:5-methylcytosine-specific restriction endonuclease McrA